MPKVSSLQASFSGGEFSPIMYGRVDTERYKSGLQTCLNYIPTLPGPLIRRPGTKYVNNVKDSANAPALIPFIFSQTQSYMLEFGDKYIRFYANGGQVITASNVFSIFGITGPSGTGTNGTAFLTALQFHSTTSNAYGLPTQAILTSSVIAAGSVLELVTPYSVADVSQIRFAQQNDTVYLAHPHYAPFKLQRFSNTEWTLSPVVFNPGPYLPLNSYSRIGDSTRITLQPSNALSGTLSTGPSYSIYGAADNGSGAIRIKTNTPHTYASGDRVFVAGVTGTVEANNLITGSAAISQTYWTITAIDPTHLDLIGSKFVNIPTSSSGVIAPALFQMYQPGVSGSSPIWADATLNQLRSMALVGSDAYRHDGLITGVTSPASATFIVMATLPDTTACVAWQLGEWSVQNGQPAAVCFHQDRLFFTGASGYPQRIDGSESSQYENFTASGSSFQVADNNALVFNLLSDQSNPLMWIKSASQGLLAGSQNAEWVMSPSSQATALTPTNFNAQQTSYFGSANVDVAQAANATIYAQRAARRIREMNYFFQVGTFRSTDLTELAETLTLPTITKLVVQKETKPLVWALRSDGVLLSMSYNRDDLTIKAGWARHILGGQSDSGGTNPVVTSMGVMPSADASYDQLWMVVKRSTASGSSYTSVEYMTKPFDDGTFQEDAFQGDCGITYDNPSAIVSISISGSSRVLSVGHGLSNGDSLQITDVVGLNISTTDINGNVSISNTVNEKTFVASDTTIGGFNLKDFQGNYISTASSSVYVSGGHVRKLISHIAGLSWLQGETIGILADGGIHPDVVVSTNSNASITLQYPAAKVQIGYRYNSDGVTLRTEGGSADGTSVGTLRRIHRYAFLLHNIGDLSVGQDLQTLRPVEFTQADNQLADNATTLFSGMIQDGVEDAYDFDDYLAWRQSSMLPGMIQSLSVFMEEFDV